MRLARQGGMDEGCPKSDGAPFLSSVHALALLYNESIVKRDMALLQRFFYSEISRRHPLIFWRFLINPANPSFSSGLSGYICLPSEGRPPFNAAPFLCPVVNVWACFHHVAAVCCNPQLVSLGKTCYTCSK